MKVAHIVEMYKLSPHGGIAVWVKRLVEYMNSRGIENRVFAYSDGMSSRIPDAVKMLPNVRELFVFPYLGRKHLPAIEKEYDIVHFSSPMTAACYKKTKPTVVSIHYLISRQTEYLSKYLPVWYKLFFNWLSISIFRFVEKRGMLNADRIIVPREAFKEYLIARMSIPEERIRVSKYGIDSEMFTKASADKKKDNVALFVGRGSLAKGFDTLAEAAKKIDGTVVAIAKNIPANLKRKIARLANVKVYANLPNEEVVSHYQQACVFVLPSLTEGSPISTLEAMASGLPVVCTSEGGGEYIRDGENGYIFDIGDAAALADKVNYLFNNRDVANRFGERNRRIVEEELTMPVIAEKVLKIYHELSG